MPATPFSPLPRNAVSGPPDVPESSLAQYFSRSATKTRDHATQFVRTERASRMLESACKTASIVSLRDTLEDLKHAQFPDEEIESMDAATRNFQTVQHRQQVNAAVVAERQAMMKLRELGPLSSERRWHQVAQALDAGHDALLKMEAVGLADRKRQVEATMKKVLGRWRLVLSNVLRDVLDAQDRHTLQLAHRWCDVARLDDVPEYMDMMDTAAAFLTCMAALEEANESGQRTLVCEAVEQAQEAGLVPERCELLLRGEQLLKQLTGKSTARWAVLVARVGSDKEVLRDVINYGLEHGLTEDELEGAEQGFGEMSSTLFTLIQIAKASRRGDIESLEKVVGQARQQTEQPRHLRPRSSLADLLGEVSANATKKLNVNKQKASIQSRIQSASSRRATVLIKEMPLHIKEAQTFGLDDDVNFAQQAYTCAVAEKKLRRAVEAADIRQLTNALSAAVGAGVDSDMIEKARQVLKQLMPLKTAMTIVTQQLDLKKLEDEIRILIERNFPAGLPDESYLRQIQARAAEERARLEEARLRIQTPIHFGMNSAVIPETEYVKIKEIAEVLKEHPHQPVTVQGFSSHKKYTLASELSRTRATHIFAELKRAGCSNILLTKGVEGVGNNPDLGSKHGMILFDQLQVGPNLKASLTKIIRESTFSL